MKSMLLNRRVFPSIFTPQVIPILIHDFKYHLFADDTLIYTLIYTHIYTSSLNLRLVCIQLPSQNSHLEV